MFTPPDASSGVPIYLQLIEQVRHAIATGAIGAGDQLPGIRRMAEDLVMNPNTVAKAYHELESEGVLLLRHGAGAFVAAEAPMLDRRGVLMKAEPIVRAAVHELRALGVTEEESRRLLDGELVRTRDQGVRSPR
jgi:GntR family transcriptional regulator